MSDSGTDDEMLIIRQQQQQNGPDPQRAARCYTRGFILALSRSDKVACPPGMKPLKQWYGEYEPPQVTGTGNGNGSSNGNNTGNSTGLLRYGALSNGGVGGRGDRDQQGGSRRGGDRDRDSRGDRDRDRDRNGTTTGRDGGSDRDRYGGDTSRGGANTKAEPAGPSGTPTATGAMGDFRLPGSRPALNLRDSEDGPRRRGGGGDGSAAGKERGERELRPWSSTTPTSTTASSSGEIGAARRTLGGDFVKKDGRAAEEGGWRSNREPAVRGSDRLGDRGDRDRRTMGNDRDGNRDRNGGLGDRGDRRRQPAWMDSTDDNGGSGSGTRQSNEPMGPGSGFPGRRLPGRERDRGGDDSSSYQRRDGHAFREHESSVPEWMASSDDFGDGALESGSNGRGFEDTLEPEDHATKKQEKVQHVDSIQAWKAEMKEIERKKRLQSEKELRREMGLADLTDAELQRKLDIRDGKVDPNEQVQVQVQAPAPVPVKAPAKSVFADFLLSGPAAPAAADSSAQDKQGGVGASTMSASGADGKTEGKPRSSRFARFFDAQGNQTSGPVASPEPTASAPSNQPQSAQPRGSQSQSQSPAPAPPSGQNLLAALLPGVDTSAPRAGPTSADAQSMMRLMEMLQMSSAGPTPAAAQSPDQRNGQAQQPGLSEHQQQQQQQQQQHPRMPPPNRGHPSPAAQQPQSSGEPSRRSASGTRQSPPMALNNGMFSPNPQPQAVALPQRNPSPQQHQQSRLAHRISGASAQGLAPPPTQQQQQPQPQPQSRRDFAALSPQPGPPVDPRGSAGITSPQAHQPLPTHMHQLPPPVSHAQVQGGVRSSMPGLPQHGNGNASEQQQAQMAAFLAAQLGQGQAGARLPPKQQQSQPQQSGQIYPGQDQQQQLQHFMNAAGQSRGVASHAHARSPSGSFTSGPVLGPQQQQQQPHHFPGQQQQQQHGRSQPADDLLRSLVQHQLPPHLQQQHQPLPPPPQQQYAPQSPAQFAQQNALAQFLAQGGHPSANFGGPASHPLPPPQSQSQQQQVPPPQARQYHVPGPQYPQQQQYTPHQQYMQPQQQHQPQQHHQPMPQQLQQSQIDLMALLTAASRR